LIAPDEPVSIEIHIVTCSTPASLYQPSEVAIVGNTVVVDMYPDGGPGDSFDELLEEIEVGGLPAGAYTYEIVLHPGDWCSQGPVPATTGTFCVQEEPCTGDSCECNLPVWTYESILLDVQSRSIGWVHGSSDAGHVAGRAYPPQGKQQAYLWYNGVTTYLGTLYPDDYESYGDDVNNHGDVVGYSHRYRGDPIAVLWRDGEVIDLRLGQASYAKAINDAGQIVGYFRPSPSTSDAFIWEDGVVTRLGMLGGAAYDINEAGVVVGRYYNGAAGHAFLWRDGVITDLGTLGSTSSVATGINDLDQVVGNFRRPGASDRYHAFLWEDGELTDLGAAWGFDESRAWVINDRGQILGWGRVGIRTYSFLSDPYKGIQLFHDLMDAGEFCWKMGAVDLGDTGLIAGSLGIYGSLDGGPVLLSPLSGPPVVPALPEDNVPKNRYISFDPNNRGRLLAYQIELAEGPGSRGVLGWLSRPAEQGCPDNCTGDFVSTVVESPVYRSWPETILHIGDCEIVPMATYELRATPDGISFTGPLEVATIHKPGERYYGDVAGIGTGALPPEPGFTGPNGVVNVVDVQAFLLTALGPTSPSAHITWVDLHGLGEGSPPNFILNVSDLQRILFGFEGQEYTDAPNQLDPADCP
jgi:probable HAF family extracellular repeat protein